MSELSKTPNLGKVLAQKLETAGVETIEQLREMGSEEAFIKIKTIDPGACINMLYAIEGAIQGIRWHGLEKSRKEELKEFYNVLERKG